jgi:hypothetical protein
MVRGSWRKLASYWSASLAIQHITMQNCCQVTPTTYNYCPSSRHTGMGVSAAGTCSDIACSCCLCSTLCPCSSGLRSDTSIVVETAQAFSTHHAAMLIGYGAHALCPYLAYETARQWRLSSRTQSLVKSGKVGWAGHTSLQNDVDLMRVARCVQHSCVLVTRDSVVDR